MASVDDGNGRQSHFIPALELKGSRVEQLQSLDGLISRLHQLRRRLVGDLNYQKGAFERAGPHIASPEWPWFLAGTSVGALVMLLLLFARGCAGT